MSPYAGVAPQAQLTGYRLCPPPTPPTAQPAIEYQLHGVWCSGGTGESGSRNYLFGRGRRRDASQTR